MNDSRRSLCVLAVVFGAACSSSDGDGVTLDEFQAEVRLTAGAGATDCGHVPIGGDRSTANCCVATNFIQSRPFAVTFDEQGIDSRVARGLSLDLNGRVTVFLFDSDPTGRGRLDNGSVDSQKCADPTLSQSPCSDSTGFPMNCD